MIRTKFPPIRTKFSWGRSYPYGTVVKIKSKRYGRKRFIFLRIDQQGKAVLYRRGPSERTSYYLLVNPLIIIKTKLKNIGR